MTARLTVPGVVARWAAEAPEARFVVTHDDALTYGELSEVSGRVAAALVRANVGKGTRVGLLMPNGVEWTVLAIGVLRAGGVLVPLSTLLRPPELRDQLQVAAVEVVLCSRGFRGRDYVADLRAIAGDVAVGLGEVQHLDRLPCLRRVAVGDDVAAAARSGCVDPLSPELLAALDRSVRPADDLAVIFTSGSRGAPKGVIHTHGGALGAIEASLGPRCLGRGDRLYLPMPFFWMGGFGGGLLSALVAGATLVTEATPEPASTLALLERERVTLFRGWPEQAAALAAHPAFAATDLGSLKPGSLDAVLPEAERRPPGARSNLFGMTESFGPYCADPLDTDLPAGKWGSCGRPIPPMEVRVVDIETRAAVTPGAVGEIELRGPNLMRGICGRLRSETFTVDGYYPTGDLGRLDAEGYLWYEGRIDDMVKVRGATVYPVEVERALAEVPGVRRAVVVDLDAAGTTVLGAAVVPADGASLQVDDLDRAARRRLSAFKVPARWAIVDADAMPMLATGKVDTAALRVLLATHGRAVRASEPGPL